MNEAERELAIQRVLVALDASPHSLAALEAAVELAAGLRVELLGLFVEDINLLRLADLPFIQEVSLFSTRRRQVVPEELERQFRTQAERVRRTMVLAAERGRVPWSFQVTRGVIATELLAAASEADLIILGRAGWSLAGPRRLGSTAQVILAQPNRLVLLLERGTHLGLPVRVIYDGSDVAQRALAIATHLGREKNGQLTVLLLAEEPETGQHLQQQAAEWLQVHGLTAQYRWLPQTDPLSLAHLLQTERGGLLVLPAGSPFLQADTLLALVNQIRSPVLLVR